MPLLVLGLFAGALTIVSSACTAGDVASPKTTAPVQSPESNATTSADRTTFHKDVEPILQRVCQRCHVSGGIAPFALLTYEDAKSVSSSMVIETQARRMPPWGAQDTGECKPPHAWKDDLRLSEQEIATIDKWHSDGDLEGNPADAPPPLAADKVVQPGLKDLTNTLSIPEFTLGARTKDTMQCFILDPKIAKKTYLNGLFFVPKNKTIVHHALAFLVPPGPAKSGGKVIEDETKPYECFGGPHIDNVKMLGGWAPGGVPTEYPENVGVELDPGVRVVVQVHYHPHANATPDPDATALQYRLTDKVPEWYAITQLAGNFSSAPNPNGSLYVGLLPGPDDTDPNKPEFLIPPNKEKHVETMVFRLPSKLPIDLRLAGLAAHMHLAGVDEKITHQSKTDGKETCLLQEPHWNFDWQRGYAYDVPIAELPIVHPGDQFNIRCTYDNRMQNSKLGAALREAGFNEPQPIRLGESTTDEMCLGAFVFLSPFAPSLANP